MSANILSIAQDFYDGAIDDPTELAALITDCKTLRTAIRQGTQTGSIISASKNGVNYATRPEFTISERLKAMSWAIQGLNANTRPSSRSYVRF